MFGVEELQLESKRELKYAEAEKEVLIHKMTQDNNMLMMGQGINDEDALFGVTTGLHKIFGKERIFDTPIAENGMMGVAIGAAMSGMRVLYMHNRPDFLMMAMDQIVNHAAKYRYMSGGGIKVPLVIWAATGQGWGAAAQHSQSIHGMLLQIPGLKIVMPSTPSDAKGLLTTALEDENPVLFLEHRKLFEQTEYVPKNEYKIPFGKGTVKRVGCDVTIIAISAMVREAIEAAKELENKGISAEIIDLRTVKPYDKEILVQSVRKTKKVVIADTSWEMGSVAKELSHFLYSEFFGYLEHTIEVVALPNVPTPASYVLEEAFYKDKKDIIDAVYKVMDLKP